MNQRRKSGAASPIADLLVAAMAARGGPSKAFERADDVRLGFRLRDRGGVSLKNAARLAAVMGLEFRLAPARRGKAE